MTSQWGVSNYRKLYCLFNRLFWLTSKKTWKPALLAVSEGNHRSAVDSPHKWSVMWSAFGYHCVIMFWWLVSICYDYFCKWDLSLDHSSQSSKTYLNMGSSNGNIVRVTSPLCGKSTGDRWIPLTKASEAELWCFLWSSPEQTVKQTIKTPVIWDVIAVSMTSL